MLCYKLRTVNETDMAPAILEFIYILEENTDTKEYKTSRILLTLKCSQCSKGNKQDKNIIQGWGKGGGGQESSVSR